MNPAVKMITFLVAIFFAAQIVLPLPAATEEETIMIDEKNLVVMPCKYVSKRIVTEAVFLDTSDNLLDDMFNSTQTRFSSKEYINFRTIEHQIMRYFIHFKDADIIPTLNEGDKIIITGVVTSCADEMAWIKVDSVIRAPVE